MCDTNGEVAWYSCHRHSWSGINQNEFRLVHEYSRIPWYDRYLYYVVIVTTCVAPVLGWSIDVRWLNRLFFVFTHFRDSRVSLVTGQQCRHRLPLQKIAFKYHSNTIDFWMCFWMVLEWSYGVLIGFEWYFGFFVPFSGIEWYFKLPLRVSLNAEISLILNGIQW